ncbi:Arc family DNA-binding protein [Pseudomonas sp. CCC3.2]|uniref:Arc family DNA-binding protein n=1 Tax=unclassified Pseudomonas TaxID=196821 RepID=UPI002AB36B46|nr:MULTISPECIES: Arc family DNA-binding protein [unclassified Pseudomonas]MDY7559966.1 Arc family DNA-binding protein [Pseudomonas sp. AB6]MEA9994535.1 Arc family DNA-binding protein [Pseudomonas sp. AA4]MEB0085679.1 Arc family DNA-binding protein [Pseudomonas sp. RTI1]MEB0125995.1 Arc family DNA-binding protein [Pseudomonas sp. CCC1.2]MEB0152800.1 Arc family DNA-binding protein [Pseudomonas sp. CCC4.3]
MSDRHVLPPYSLRMAADLREKLEKSSLSLKRSLNAEIIARLERSFAEDEAIEKQVEYEKWLETNPADASELSIVSMLSYMRHLAEATEGALKTIERLYDEKTGEHFMTINESGEMVKSYER